MPTLETSPETQTGINLPDAMTCSLLNRHGSTLVGRQKRASEHRDGRIAAGQALQRLNCYELPCASDDSCPDWPNGFVGSISHTQNFAWAVAAPKPSIAAVGIDTELIATNETVDSLWDQIATTAEYDLAHEAGLDRALAFTTIFSAKESIFKCTYPDTRIFFDFKDATVIRFGDRELSIRINDDCPNTHARGNTLNVAWNATANDVFTACWTTETTAKGACQ